MKKFFLLSVLILGLSLELYAASNSTPGGPACSQADDHASDFANFMNHYRDFVRLPIEDILKDPDLMHSKYIQARLSLARLSQNGKYETSYQSFLTELQKAHKEFNDLINAKTEETNAARMQLLSNKAYMEQKKQEAYAAIMAEHHKKNRTAITSSVTTTSVVASPTETLPTELPD